MPQTTPYFMGERKIENLGWFQPLAPKSWIDLLELGWLCENRWGLVAQVQALDPLWLCAR